MRHLQRGLAFLAPWTGLATLAYVIGGAMWLQWAHVNDPLGSLGAAVLGGLSSSASVCLVAGAIALGSGRVRREVVALAAVVVMWLGSGHLSSWALTGNGHVQTLQVMATGVGLILAVAAVPTERTGWVLLLLGSTYIAANLHALWVNFFTTGGRFPGVGVWQDGLFGVKYQPPFRPDWAPAPQDIPGRLAAFWRVDQLSAAELVGPPRIEYQRYFQFGLASNPNATGTVVAVALAASAPMLVGVARRAAGRWARLMLHGATALLLLAGLALLWILDARTSLAGATTALVVTLIPLGWARARASFAWVFSVAVLVIILAPVMLASAGVLSFSGRDCIWRALGRLVSVHPVLGNGPPGTLSGPCASRPTLTWTHAHNEILQAWNLGGILGLLATLVIFGGLAYWALRFHDRDQRSLLAMMACLAVLLGLEVLSPPTSEWVRPGLTIFLAVAARSVQMMASGSRPTALTTPTPPDADPLGKPLAIEAPG